MPWHVAHNLSINCKNRIVKVVERELANDSFEEAEIKILNLSVKKFRNMMKKTVICIYFPSCSENETYEQIWNGRRNFEILESRSQNNINEV